MRDNEYYRPTDEQKSISNEKETLENQQATIIKRKLNLKKNNKKKKNAANQTSALAMGTAAVVMVSVTAYPINAVKETVDFTGYWTSEIGVHMEISEDNSITFSSENVEYEFILYAETVNEQEMVAIASMEVAQGEVIANYIDMYGGEIVDGEFNITLLKTSENELILHSPVFLGEEVFVRASPPAYVAPSIIGTVYENENGDELLVDENNKRILYFYDENFGIVFPPYQEEQGILTSRTTAYQLDQDGDTYRSPELDDYFRGEYEGDNGIRVDITIGGRLVADNELFTIKSELKDDGYWEELYDIIYRDILDNETTPQVEPTQNPDIQATSEPSVYIPLIYWDFSSPFTGIWQGTYLSDENDTINFIIAGDNRDEGIESVVVMQYITENGIPYMHNSYMIRNDTPQGEGTIITDTEISTNGVWGFEQYTGDEVYYREHVWGIDAIGSFYFEGDNLIYSINHPASDYTTTYTLSKVNDAPDTVALEWIKHYRQMKEEQMGITN